jgi:hypothetical protein
MSSICSDFGHWDVVLGLGHRFIIGSIESGCEFVERGLPPSPTEASEVDLELLRLESTFLIFEQSEPFHRGLDGAEKCKPKFRAKEPFSQGEVEISPCNVTG